MKIYSECVAGGITTSTATCQHTVCAHRHRKIEGKKITCCLDENAHKLAQPYFLNIIYFTHSAANVCPAHLLREDSKQSPCKRGEERSEKHETKWKKGSNVLHSCYCWETAEYCNRKLSQCERDKNSCLTGLLRLAPNCDSTIKKPNFTSYPPCMTTVHVLFCFNLSTILKLCVFVATLTYRWIPGQAAVADGCLLSFTSELLNCSSRPRMSNSFYIMGHIQPSLILHGLNQWKSPFCYCKVV